MSPATIEAQLARLDQMLRLHPWWPQITLPEVGQAIDEVRSYMVRHQQFIIAHGLPPTPAPSSRWLFRRLGRLYDTRATSSPEPRATVGPDPFDSPYTWGRLRGDTPAGEAAGASSTTVPQPSSPRVRRPGRTTPRTPPSASSESLPPVRSGIWTPVERPRDADPQGGLTETDARRVERERARLFRFKLDCLGHIREAIGDAGLSGRDRAYNLRSACLRAVESAFTAPELRFYLRIDRRRRGSDAGGGSHPSPTVYPPGGLSDLLEFAGEVELELREGASQQLHDLLPQPLRNALLPSGGEPFEAELVWRNDGSPPFLQVLTPTLPRGVRRAVIADAVRCAEGAAGRRWRWGIAHQDAVAAALCARFQRSATALFGERHVEWRQALLVEYAEHLANEARRGVQLEAPFAAPGEVPYWDAGSRYLYISGQRVARYKMLLKADADQIGMILDAFQQACWPEAIGDPLPPLKAGASEERRKEKVKSLNAGIKQGEISFHRHAGGFRWQRDD